jgi:hypothetical protein
MLSWLKAVFHPHKWKTIREGDYYSDGVCVGRVYYQQCEICGKVRRRVLY